MVADLPFGQAVQRLCGELTCRKLTNRGETTDVGRQVLSFDRVRAETAKRDGERRRPGLTVFVYIWRGTARSVLFQKRPGGDRGYQKRPGGDRGYQRRRVHRTTYRLASESGRVRGAGLAAS